jgi:putative transcriptional regulator
MLDMTIYNRLKILIAEKEFREDRKLTYRTISEETGISTSTLTLYMRQGVGAFDTGTIETLCKYFDCQPGDLIVYADNPPSPKKKK